ncbi:MAG: beta-N-acetylglucosaminidase domain-containing protein [Anaerolineales bacterium]|nr:beta-N-acetylglucosaminidase domain-containing protein [Anaerolineales bacterium]
MRLGLIEGFYGPLWQWSEREVLAEHLAAAGYRFWHYAPKADPGVRDDWRNPWSTGHAEALSAFAARCRGLGLRFGIGLSPLGLAGDGPRADWDALAARLAELDAIGIDDLVIAFDDVRGDHPDLAREQARIVDWMAARTHADRVIVCPTYYSDDPLLDRLFGERPVDYLDELGYVLDQRIAVYWTGEEVCAREINTGPLARVTERLRRAPWLWDNYPVNDGRYASDHLHLRPFTGRPAALADAAGAHAINPALQPTLSALPALTLAQRYREGDAFAYIPAFHEAARAVLGADLAAAVAADLPLLEEAGRHRLGDAADGLRARYAAFDHPAAREIVHWLDGGYSPGHPAPGTMV